MVLRRRSAASWLSWPLVLLLAALVPAACEGSGSAPAPAASASGRPESSASPASGAPSPALSLLAREYKGTLGAPGSSEAPAAIVMRLFHDETRVTGSYFKESSGTAVVLSGSASDVQLSLDETVDGSKTGTLALDVAPDGALTGKWTGLGADGSSPVHLEAIVPAAHAEKALVLKRSRREVKPVRDAKSKDDVCKLSLDYAEAYGLPATVEAKVNAELAPAAELVLPSPCDRPALVTADYRVAHDADGILSVRITAAVASGKDDLLRRPRVVNAVLESGASLKLFGDVVKPKAEKTFESAENQQIAAAARRQSLDANGRKLLDQALSFSPPFVLEDKGLRLFPDALPPAPGPALAALGLEGVLVSYATLPRPHSPAAVFWGK